MSALLVMSLISWFVSIALNIDWVAKSNKVVASVWYFDVISAAEFKHLKPLVLYGFYVLLIELV